MPLQHLPNVTNWTDILQDEVFQTEKNKMVLNSWIPWAISSFLDWKTWATLDPNIQNLKKKNN